MILHFSPDTLRMEGYVLVFTYESDIDSAVPTLLSLKMLASMFAEELTNNKNGN